MDKKTLIKICDVLYSTGFGEEKPSRYLVFDLANSINEHCYAREEDEPIYWAECEPCDDETPRYQDSGCLVCGQ